ncbi:MAG: copper resistance protein CopC [Thermoleophilia bacterium]|nr:copper resistance protein CopC [Thermoleophilia bacterium]
MHRCLLIVIGLMLLLLPSTALAHSTLLESTPAIDSTVEVAPDEIVMRFSDPITVPDGVVSVRDLAGREHVAAGVIVDEKVVTIPLDDAAAEGTRVVAWNGISDHGTQISGSFVYHVKQPTAGADQGTAAVAEDTAQRELTALFRTTALTGLIVAIIAAIVVAAARQRARTSAVTRSVLIGTSVVVALAIMGGFVAAPDSDWLFAGAKEPAATRLEQPVSLGDGATATVTLDPVVAGQMDIIVDVRTADGSPDEGAQKSHIRYRPTNRSMGYFKRELTRDGKGQFSADDVTVPFRGEWDFEITVAADEFSASLANFTATIQPNPELAR